MGVDSINPSSLFIGCGDSIFCFALESKDFFETKQSFRAHF